MLSHGSQLRIRTAWLATALATALGVAWALPAAAGADTAAAAGLRVVTATLAAAPPPAAPVITLGLRN